MKMNLGASRNWSKEGWSVLDHKLDKTEGFKISGDMAQMDLDDKVCDLVFTSHVLEHIPHTKLQEVMIEINRIMKIGSGLRILIPDLKKAAVAYVNNDLSFFKGIKEEDETLRTDLGIGGMLMNYIVASGQDTMLFNRECNKFIAGYSHLYAYDFEMMELILKNYGFTNIRKVGFCESKYSDFKEPLHVRGLESKWQSFNKEFYQKNNLTHKYENGSYVIDFENTGFDKNPNMSLIIEAEKGEDFSLSKENDFNDEDASNYNSYALSMLEDKLFKDKVLLLEGVSEKLCDSQFKKELIKLLKA
jgi:predicted SAM-dependent methyltransferase